MEEVYNYTTAQDFDYSIYYSNDVGETTFDYEKALFIEKVVTWIIISVSIPLNIAAIYSCCSQVRKDHVPLIYVINLLASNIIQLCSMIGLLTAHHPGLHEFWVSSYVFGLMTCLGFMVCISLERYLVITSPRCSCFRQAIQISEVVCLVVWAVPLLLVLRVPSFERILGPGVFIVFIIFLLLPFPLFIFFLGGTLKALSAAISVPREEKRKTVTILSLMLLIYTLLILPALIVLLLGVPEIPLIRVFLIIPRLIPLANVFLYCFLRKGAGGSSLHPVCCCSKNNSEMSS